MRPGRGMRARRAGGRHLLGPDHVEVELVRVLERRLLLHLLERVLLPVEVDRPQLVVLVLLEHAQLRARFGLRALAVRPRLHEVLEGGHVGGRGGIWWEGTVVRAETPGERGC